MAMVDVDGSSLTADSQPKSVGSNLALSLHLPDKPGGTLTMLEAQRQHHSNNPDYYFH